MLNEDELRDALLLVFANKQDLPNSATAEEIIEVLDLHRLDRERPWQIYETVGTEKENQQPGLDWIQSVCENPEEYIQENMNRTRRVKSANKV